MARRAVCRIPCRPPASQVGVLSVEVADRAPRSLAAGQLDRRWPKQNRLLLGPVRLDPKGEVLKEPGDLEEPLELLGSSRQAELAAMLRAQRLDGEQRSQPGGVREREVADVEQQLACTLAAERGDGLDQGTCADEVELARECKPVRVAALVVKDSELSVHPARPSPSPVWLRCGARHPRAGPYDSQRPPRPPAQR